MKRMSWDREGCWGNDVMGVATANASVSLPNLCVALTAE